MMNSINYPKLALSVSIIVFVAAAAIGGTQAFFSDTETSTGNTFTAGDIDLRIGNESYYSALNADFDGSDPQSELPENEQNTFAVDDLNEGQVFFAFNDLKPGDLSEDTITIEVGSNDAYACAYLETTADDDGTCNEPEMADDLSCVEDNANEFDGELGEQLNFAFWADDGDNVYEAGEQILTTGNAASAQGGLAYTLADSQGNIFTGDTNPLTGDEQYHIGKAWCFGELTEDALDQIDDGGPDVRGSGFTCTGAEGTDNASQTDVVEGIVSFYAVQSRNNADFTCENELFTELNEVDERPLVGATAFAYSEPATEQCDLTVDATIGADTATEFATLAAAEAEADDGDVICVDTGTYSEDVTVDVPNVTFLGLNDPSGGSAAIVEGRMDIDSDGVTVTGLAFTNPDVGYGIVIDGANDTTIENSVFEDIGTTVVEGSAQAIYYNMNDVDASGFTVSGNTINNIGNTSMVSNGGSSAKGIFVGDSAADGDLSGLVVENNTITNIFASNAAFVSGGGGGAGAYAVLINIGANTGTGETVSPRIAENSIETLDGLWSHAIGLEGPTPNAEVVQNEVADLEEDKGGTDAWAVFIEDNTGVGTLAINFNNFASNMVGGVANAFDATSVDAENNWWGDNDPSDDIGGTIDFTPYQTTALPTN